MTWGDPAWASPWLGMAVAAAAAGGWWGLLFLAHREGKLAPETARKLLHVATGLLGLSFPWLFDEPWPPLVLVAGTLLGLAAVRLVPRARASVGSVIHDVERASWGEFYLPLAIAALWVLSYGNWLLYSIPLLVLTFADATAALVGVRYGQHKYAADEGTKSREGSLAFFVVAFLVTHVVLLLGSTTGRLESLLVAAILGFLVMLLEGMAWRGLDNLLIPILGFLLLQTLLPLPPFELALRLAVLAGLALFVLAWSRRTTLQGGALFGAVLVGYLFWTLVSWEWVVAPLIFFAGYSWLPPRSELDRAHSHNAQTVLWVCSASLAWLLLARLFTAPALIVPSTVAFAAHLGMTCAVRLRFARPDLSDTIVVAASLAQGIGLILLPFAILEGMTQAAWQHLALGTASVALATGTFHMGRIRKADPLPAGYRWPRQAAWAAVASVLAALPTLLQFFGVIP